MKILQSVLLAMLAAAALTGAAFADVISGPLYAMVLGVPLFSIAVIILVAVLVIRSVARASKQRREAEKRSEEMHCLHEDAESHAKKSSWDNRDPWD